MPLLLLLLLLQITAWYQHTIGPFQEIWLEGLGHNYIPQAPEKLFTAIKTQLLTMRQEQQKEKQQEGVMAADIAVECGM